MAHRSTGTGCGGDKKSIQEKLDKELERMARLSLEAPCAHDKIKGQLSTFLTNPPTASSLGLEKFPPRASVLRNEAKLRKEALEAKSFEKAEKAKAAQAQEKAYVREELEEFEKQVLEANARPPRRNRDDVSIVGSDFESERYKSKDSLKKKDEEKKK